MQEEIVVRTFDPSKDSIESVAKVWSDSFGSLQAKTGITEDLSNFYVSVEVAKHALPLGFVAVNKDGKIVGVNFVTEPDEACIKETNIDAREVGPIGVMSRYQGHNLGRRLMQILIDHATSNTSAQSSIRLLVNTHNPVSYSLYLSLGFVPQQTVTCLIKTPKPVSLEIPSHLKCRRMMSEDIPACNHLAKHVTGIFCNNNLVTKVNEENYETRWEIPFVLEEWSENSSKIVAFCSGFTIADFTIAKSVEYCKYLFTYVSTHFEYEDNNQKGPYLLVNALQYPELLNWFISLGMKVEKNMFYMVRGKYTQAELPHVYLCSVGGFL